MTTHVLRSIKAVRVLGRLGLGLGLAATLGLAPLAAQEADAAVEQLELAIRGKGLDASADDYRRLGDAYLQAGRVIEAAGALEQAVDKGATDRDLLVRLGRLWDASGRVDKAVPVYAAAVQAAPEHPDAPALMLRSARIIDQIAGDRDRSMEMYREVAERYTSTPAARDAVRAGFQVASDARSRDWQNRFGAIAVRQFPEDRGLLDIGLHGADHLARSKPAAVVRSYSALMKAHPGLTHKEEMGRHWAEALRNQEQVEEGFAILMRFAEGGNAESLWQAAEYADRHLEGDQKAQELYVRLIAQHPGSRWVRHAADRAGKMGADLSQHAETIKIARLYQEHHNKLLHRWRKDKPEKNEQRSEWFGAIDLPLGAWHPHLLREYMQWAVDTKNLDAYREAMLVMARRHGEWRAVDDAVRNHGSRARGEWLDDLLQALKDAGIPDHYIGRYHVRMAERVHGHNRDAFLKHAKIVLENYGNNDWYRSTVLHLLLDSALEENAQAMVDKYAAAVVEQTRKDGGRGNYTLRLLQQAYGKAMADWPRDRRVDFLELMLRVGRNDAYVDWPGRALVEDALRHDGPIEAGMTTHRAIDACHYRRKEQYDSMMGLAAKLAKLGHHGVAAGAYDHIARHFTGVGGDRVTRARQEAGRSMGRLGGAVVESLMDIDENDPLAPILRAQAKLSLGDEDEAYRLAEPALDLMVQNAGQVSMELAQMVARNLSRTKRYDEATNLLQAWIRSRGGGSQEAVIQLAIGDIRFASENYPAALLEFQSVIASYPDTPEATDAKLRIGDCQLAMRQYDEARNVYEQVLNHESEQVRAKATFRMAVLESERGNEETALKLFREVARMNPSEDLANQLYLDWGKALIDRNRLAEAEDVIMMVGLQAGREPIAPGEPLRITLNDPFLHTSQNRSSVPVLVQTASGDREVVELTLSQDVKGMFTSRLTTTLGETIVGDNILQITGDDTITYDYTPEFKKNRKTMTIGSGEIPIASQGALKVSASMKGVRFDVEGDDDEARLDKLGFTFDTEELKQAREIASSESRTYRGENHVKPGNPVYLSVLDPDRDTSSGTDRVGVVVESSSGDRVQVHLDETGPHSGLFKGEMETGLMPPDVDVTDTATGSSPLTMLLDPKDPEFESADAAWVAAGDLKGGKAVTLDFKEVRPVDRFLWSRGWALPKGERKTDPGKRPGLAATFYANTKLEGRVIHEAQGLPGHENMKVPGHGQHNWSVRWSGEVRVPEDGTYEFAARSDDGCRIIVHGEDIFGGNHWRGQGPTTRKATVDMRAGWVPIQVEYFQGGGGGSLEVAFGPEGKAEPLTHEQLRARPSVDPGPKIDRVPTRYRVLTSTNGRDWTPLVRNGGGVMPRGWLVRTFQKDDRIARTGEQANDAMQRVFDDGAYTRPDDRALRDKQTWYLKASELAPIEQADAAHQELVRGTILIPEAGVWEFAVRSGGRTWVKVGGRMVVAKGRDEADEQPGEGAAEAPRWRGTVELPYGLTSLGLVRSSDQGHSGLQLLWRRPGSETFEPVPAAAIHHEAGNGAITELTGRGVPKVERLTGRYGERVHFDPVDTRFLRLVIDRWNDGDAPAVARVAAWEGDRRIVPAEGVDYRSLANNDVLELSAGDVVTATYLDRKTKEGTSENRRGRLTATYYDGHLAFQEARAIADARGRLREFLYARYRFSAGERLTVRVVDYDLDVSNQADTVDVTLTSAAGEVTVSAIETGLATGTFQGEIRTAPPGSEASKDTLVVADGEQIIASFMDTENLHPGGSTKRSVTIREAVTSEGVAAIRPTRLQTFTRNGKVETEVIADDPVEEDAPVALAPLQIVIDDPDSVISRGSEARVRITTDRGASVDVALSPRAARGVTDTFEGSVALVLGSPETTKTWRIPAPGQAQSRARLKVGGLPRGADAVVPVRGGERITVTYLEGLERIAGKAAADELFAAGGLPTATAVLVTDGVLEVVADDFETPVEEAYVGGELFFKVTDADADASDERDRVVLDVTSDLGDRLSLELEETQSHSGVFMGSVDVTHSDSAVPDDDGLQTTFGDELEIAYVETTRGSGDAPSTVVPVSLGHDAIMDGFAKRYGDDQLAAMTHIKMAECYFELYKTHREKLKELEKSQGSKEDIANLEQLIEDELDSGTKLLRQTIHSYPDLDEIDEVLFLLANFEQEGGSPLQAIDRYRALLAGYPSSVRAPEAQYKMAQCYEELQRYDDAWESYVRLAYRWPEHDLVADSMARIGDYYEQRGKELLVAAEREWKKANQREQFPIPDEAREDLLQAERVYGQLVERFGDREVAPPILLKQGNCHWLLRNYGHAEAVFASFAERYPESPYLPTSMYWAGRAALESGDARSAYIRFGSLIRDFPETKDAKRARGMMLQDARLKDISFTED